MRRRRAGAVATAALLALALALGSGEGQSPPGPALPANTWVRLSPGGVVAGAGVGDEGYSSFVYSPGLGRAVVFGKYHARELGWGEDQNALLAYDVSGNRWDVLEITEAAWSEFLPGVGHDQGHVAVDPRRDLYITRGNMTLHGNTAYQTYVFDLKAGRGRRMLPAREPGGTAEVASAFDPHTGLMLTTKGQSWLYDPARNEWSDAPRGPSPRAAPGLVYDDKHRVFVLFGGGGQAETWTFDAAARAWTRRSPAQSPPGRKAPNMAFDPVNGVTLLVGGIGPRNAPLDDMWAYDAGADTWTRLPYTAPPKTGSQAGNSLVYDTRHRVFLLKEAASLRTLWAFRYEPGAAAAPRSWLGPATAHAAPALDLPPRTWVARPLPGRGKGPTGGKHMRLAWNATDGRVYVLGGDYGGPGGEDSGRNEVYSYGVADDTWRLEHPYCGAAGSVQPSHPDEVGWVYDTRRRLFWMLPGYMGAPRPGECPGAQLVRWRLMTFDPATRRWDVPARAAGETGERVKFAVYDPVSDSIVRFYFDGGSGAASATYDIEADRWTRTIHRHDRHGVSVNEARLGQEYAALDVEGRRAWLIDPVRGRLYAYDLERRQLEDRGETPARAQSDSAMPVWDPVARVLLWPHIPAFSRATVTLFVYHPDSGAWERDQAAAPRGLRVMGNAAVFDPASNALLLLGGHGSRHLFLYRYAPGPRS